MNARRFTATVALTVALTVAIAVGVAGGLAACSSPTSTAADPDLRSRGAEAPVAVTTPGGATWEREGGRATLVVPADLLFASDSAELGPAATETLGRVIDEARARPGSAANVLVEGHADADGDADHNHDLSELRAAAVADRLTAEGLDPSTITTRGWGETRPVAQGTDEAAKSENRRVVITVDSSNQRRIR